MHDPAMYSHQVDPILLGLKVSLSPPMVTIIGRCVLAFFHRTAALTRRKKWRLRTTLPAMAMKLESAMKPMPEVLLVDDNAADVFLASEALTVNPCSCLVSSVGDGAEALAFLRHEGRYAATACPDVMILDPNLPKKSGEVVLAEVKSDPNLRKIPVVIFSSSRANKDIVQLRTGGKLLSQQARQPERICFDRATDRELLRLL